MSISHPRESHSKKSYISVITNRRNATFKSRISLANTSPKIQILYFVHSLPHRPSSTKNTLFISPPLNNHLQLKNPFLQSHAANSPLQFWARAIVACLGLGG